MTTLLEEDDRWEDGSREYFYVHHLASRTGIPGAGSAFLELIEDYARKQGKRGIRLDCQLGNEPLNRFYETVMSLWESRLQQAATLESERCWSFQKMMLPSGRECLIIKIDCGSFPFADCDNSEEL